VKRSPARRRRPSRFRPPHCGVSRAIRPLSRLRRAPSLHRARRTPAPRAPSCWQPPAPPPRPKCFHPRARTTTRRRMKMTAASRVMTRASTRAVASTIRHQLPCRLDLAEEAVTAREAKRHQTRIHWRAEVRELAPKRLVALLEEVNPDCARKPRLLAEAEVRLGHRSPRAHRPFRGASMRATPTEPCRWT